MPTALPRHQITETPDVARAIDSAAQRWPGERRSELLRRLIGVAAEVIRNGDDASMTGRREAIMATSGGYADAFGPDYLDELRQDWPA